MWPSNIAFGGASTSFGIEGIPYLVKSEDKSESKWNFPQRSNNKESSQFFKVKYSTKKIINPQLKTDLDIFDDKNNEEISNIVSPDLKKQLLREAKNFNSKYVYDPVIGKLFTSYLFPKSSDNVNRTENSQMRVMAFVSGPEGSVLNVINLKKNFERLCDKNEEEIELLSCKFGKHMATETKSPINEIIFGNSTISSNSCLLITRSNNCFHIFKLFNNMNLEIFKTLTCQDLKLKEIADISFNKKRSNLIGIIDIDGSWMILKITKSFLKVELKGKFDSKESLSRWKKFIWGDSLKFAVLADRLFLYKISWGKKLIQNIIEEKIEKKDRVKRENSDSNSESESESELESEEEEEVKEISKDLINFEKIFIPQSSSKILHVEISPDKFNELFILTSSEIIWGKFDENDKFQVILMWSHLLNPDDSSLRFDINLDNGYGKNTRLKDEKSYYGENLEFINKERNYIILVHSSIHSVNFFYRFKFDEVLSSYIINGDPSLIKSNSNFVIQNCLLLPSPEIIDDDEEEVNKNVAKNSEFLTLYQISTDLEITKTLLSRKPLLIMKKHYKTIDSELNFDLVNFKNDYFFKLFNYKAPKNIIKLIYQLTRDDDKEDKYIEKNLNENQINYLNFIIPTILKIKSNKKIETFEQIEKISENYSKINSHLKIDYKTLTNKLINYSKFYNDNLHLEKFFLNFNLEKSHSFTKEVLSNWDDDKIDEFVNSEPSISSSYPQNDTIVDTQVLSQIPTIFSQTPMISSTITSQIGSSQVRVKSKKRKRGGFA